MKRFLLAALAAFSVLPALAAPVSVTWTRPTAYTDGSALAASAISGYKIGCTFTPTSGTASACTLSASTAAGTSQSFNATLTYPATGGAACFTVITTAGGVDSVPSNSVCKTLDAVAPNPPSNVTVTVTIALNLTSASPITVALAGPPVVTKTP